MTNDQVLSMLKDSDLVWNYMEDRPDIVSCLARDCSLHIKALAGERESYRAALEMMLQIGHDYGEMKLPRMIAKAVLAGADMADQEEAIAVCSGKWKPRETSNA